MDQDANDFGSHFITILHKMSHWRGFILGLCCGCQVHSANMMQSGLSLKIVSVIPYNKYRTQFVTRVNEGIISNMNGYRGCLVIIRQGEERRRD